MYLLIKILIIIFCLGGILYLVTMNKKYKNDDSTTKEEIIQYFKDQQADSVESGIKTKDLPITIAKNPYLLMMVKDKTLIFKKGKYYLNTNKYE